MWKHAKHYWGDDIIKKADEAKEQLTLNDFWKSLAVAKMAQDGSITVSFNCQGTAKLKYMMCQHTYKEGWSVLLFVNNIYSLISVLVLNMSVGVLRVCGASR